MMKTDFIRVDGSFDKKKYNDLFDNIKNNQTEEYLDEIAKKYNVDFNPPKYPRLALKISKDEIDDLIKLGIISRDNSEVKISIEQNQLDPIAKLLYVLSWKQGDLQKLNLIIKGIQEAAQPNPPETQGLVFYCFGNHLVNKTKYPIIDQHVIRAFKLYKCDGSNIESIRRLDKVELDDRKAYLEWFKGMKDPEEDYLYKLDRILFELGKALKEKKKKKPLEKAV